MSGDERVAEMHRRPAGKVTPDVGGEAGPRAGELRGRCNAATRDPSHDGVAKIVQGARHLATAVTVVDGWLVDDGFLPDARNGE